MVPSDLPPLPPPDAKDPPQAQAAAEPAAPLPTPSPSPSPSPPPAATEAPASSPAAPAPAPGAAARSGADAKVDPQVLTTAADPTAMHAEGSPVKLTEAGHIAARVGDEVITLNELTAAVKERIAKLPGEYKPTHQEIKTLTSQVLDTLIERSTIIQEAKRELKKPEQLKLLYDYADKAWRDEELPPLLRQYAVENEHKLKAKLAEQGKSLDQMRETYRQEFLARGFLEQKLKHKITVTVPEMRDYYNAHIDDFNRPEQWTWREVLIEVDKHPNRAAARRKAEAILDRLRHGEDFAKLAQTESEGPNRTSGGLWETAPESYAVAAVNNAVKSLPIGQVSPIIEGPSSYHLVRVEARRAAGPATFPEVQDRIRKIVHHRKADKESNAFLDKLRQQTVVTTIFDHTDYAPSATRPTNPETTTASTH
jgi:peptidyl-prolyl cis-trans isomerase SurA